MFLLAVIRALVFEDVLADPMADFLVKQHEARVDGACNAFAAREDKSPN